MDEREGKTSNSVELWQNLQTKATNEMKTALAMVQDIRNTISALQWGINKEASAILSAVPIYFLA